MAELREHGIVSKTRTLKSGKTVGGIAFTRGPLAHLLRNRFYIGEVSFKSEILRGEQEAILDHDVFEAVQAKLDEQANSQKRTRTRSEAPLTGRIFDDAGNRMSPTHARKAGVKYRYYLSSALLNGAAERAGSVARVPAAEVEAVVVKSVREHVGSQRAIDDRTLIETHDVRVEVHTDHLTIKLAQAEAEDDKTRLETVLSVPWQKMGSTRRREILIPEGTSPQRVRRIRSENRATLVASIARSRRWLNELISDPAASPESIGEREQSSIRNVNRTLSLAFLAPDLVKAAIDGRLPHGMGVTRFADLPAEWSRQRRILGLAPR
jgi:site-specific DNA recombinase